jgi:hypothetical protein
MRRSSYSVNVLLACLAIYAFAGSAAAQSARVEDTLQERYGLYRLPSTNIWAVPLEFEVRNLWHELPRHRDAVLALDVALNERIQLNARDWATAAKTEQTLRLALAALDLTDRSRERLQLQLKNVRSGLIPPERLGDQEQVRAQLIELVDRRNALWLGAQTLRHKTRLLPDAYAPLASDDQVSGLLKKLGGKHRLGPARNYLHDLKKLPELEKVFLTDWLPLFSAGERQRLTLIANESTPVTFTWTSSPEPTLITAAMAETIGLQPRANAEERKIAIAGKTYQVRAATIAYLQAGKYQLREVEAWILPPEAEVAGAQIGPAAFAGFRVEVQPTRLRAVLTPLAEK